MTTKIYLSSILVNDVKSSRHPQWVEQEVGKYFDTMKELSKYYKVRNCNYHFEKNGVVVKTVNNGKVNKNGQRYEEVY